MKRSLIAALFLGLATTAFADPASPLRRAQLSAELYARGLAEADPVLILTAAQLRKAAGLGQDAEDPLSWQAMLGAARALAPGDAALAPLFDDLEAVSAKGVISGAVQQKAALDPGEATLPPMEFKGGAKAEVYVETAPGFDLNLIVRDATGKVVCRDIDPSFVAHCLWTPAQDGLFLLTVENRGKTPIDYTLLTN